MNDAKTLLIPGRPALSASPSVACCAPVTDNRWGESSAKWNYCFQGKDWILNEPENSDIRLQSPIDLPKKSILLNEDTCFPSTSSLNNIIMDYTPVPSAYTVSHIKDRTIKVNVDTTKSSNITTMGYLNFNNKLFKVTEFHFHSPAEHTFDKERPALELHVVHAFCQHIDPTNNSTLFCIEQDSLLKQGDKPYHLNEMYSWTKVTNTPIPVQESDELVVLAFTFNLPDVCNRFNSFFNKIEIFPGYPSLSNPATSLENEQQVIEKDNLNNTSNSIISHENDFLKKVLGIKNFPFEGDQETTVVNELCTIEDTQIPLFNLSSLMTNVPLKFFNYFGSLTTPPCDERVHWFVLATPLVASEAQLTTFNRIFSYHGTFGNFRILQGRGIPDTVSKPTCFSNSCEINKLPQTQIKHSFCNNSLDGRSIETKINSQGETCSQNSDMTIPKVCYRRMYKESRYNIDSNKSL